jgi:hypothetical protein
LYLSDGTSSDPIHEFLRTHSSEVRSLQAECMRKYLEVAKIRKGSRCLPGSRVNKAARVRRRA